MKKVYIAGKISGLPLLEYLSKFDEANYMLTQAGHRVLDPTIIVPAKLDYEDQMAICMRLVEITDAVYMLDNWKDSNGAKRELAYAQQLGKEIIYQEVRDDE